MKILFITHYAAYLGANRSMVTLLRELKNQPEMQLMVYCPQQGELTEMLQKENIPFEIHPFINWGYSYRSVKYWAFRLFWWNYLKNKFPAILARARDFDPDIIHSNSSVVSLGWQLAEQLNCRHVWHIREFGYADYKIRFLLGHDFFISKLKAADRIIFISDAIRDHYLQQAPDLKYLRIYNGVFDAAPAPPDQVVGKHFLILGMLHPSKGQLDALKSLKLLVGEFPDIKLMIVGEGWKSYKAQLSAFIRQNGLDKNAFLPGYISEPAEWISNAYSLLVCSRNEAMGRVTAEAMAQAVPVIGYDAAATAEIINNSKGGLLYRTVEELAAQMRLILTDQPLRRQLGLQGYDFARSNFTAQQYAQRVIEVYREVLAK